MITSGITKAVRISAIQSSDYSAWARLFRAYVDFYESSLPDEQYRQTFGRITDPKTDLAGLGLRESGPNGKLFGIMHFFPHQTPWSEKQILHINDLFIDPAFRGNGYGRQMIQEAGRIAKEKDYLRVQWATQHGNPARKLYDELAVCNFVEYRMKLPPLASFAPLFGSSRIPPDLRPRSSCRDNPASYPSFDTEQSAKFPAAISMSQVKNLRAVFESSTDSASSDIRGRSPGASSSASGSPRPLSNIRTNFVAVEKDGRVGLQRTPSGQSDKSAPRMSEEPVIDAVAEAPAAPEQQPIEEPQQVPQASSEAANDAPAPAAKDVKASAPAKKASTRSFAAPTRATSAAKAAVTKTPTEQPKKPATRVPAVRSAATTSRLTKPTTASAAKQPLTSRPSAASESTTTRPRTTKPINVSSSLLAPTASSVNKTGRPSLGGSSVAATRAPVKRPSLAASTTTRPRPSLGGPPRQTRPASASSKRPSNVDESFLARMTRPTQASTNKTGAEKAAEKSGTTPPPRKPASRPSVAASGSRRESNVRRAAPAKNEAPRARSRPTPTPPAAKPTTKSSAGKAAAIGVAAAAGVAGAAGAAVVAKKAVSHDEPAVDEPTVAEDSIIAKFDNLDIQEPEAEPAKEPEAEPEVKEAEPEAAVEAVPEPEEAHEAAAIEDPLAQPEPTYDEDLIEDFHGDAPAVEGDLIGDLDAPEPVADIAQGTLEDIAPETAQAETAEEIIDLAAEAEHDVPLDEVVEADTSEEPSEEPLDFGDDIPFEPVDLDRKYKAADESSLFGSVDKDAEGESVL